MEFVDLTYLLEVIGIAKVGILHAYRQAYQVGLPTLEGSRLPDKTSDMYPCVLMSSSSLLLAPFLSKGRRGWCERLYLERSGNAPSRPAVPLSMKGLFDGSLSRHELLRGLGVVRT